MLTTLGCFFCVSSAFAMDVSPNIFLAAGPATPAYFENLQKVQQALKTVSTAAMGEFKFNGAQVNAKDQKVTYFFHHYEGVMSDKTCWSQVSFQTDLSQQATVGPQFGQVRAELVCHSNQD